jgi:type I restriction enzyme M protein
MTTTHDIVQKLWSLCNVLRDDGITYHQYVTELTYLLFLKMTEETGMQETDDVVHLPEGLRWPDLSGKDGNEQLQFYRRMLVDLGNEGSELVQQIFLNAQTAMRQPRNLNKLVTSIDELDWFSAKREGLGDLYEGLLEKNASESKTGAGQYFTPRPLINVIVELIDPQPGEVVQDPAAGTGGFIIAADLHVKGQSDDLFDLDEQLQEFQRHKAFRGVELVPDTHRLGLMNMLLHDIDCDFKLGDTLSPMGTDLARADVILSNPPFGTKRGGGRPTRDDFTFPTSNKQLAFLQHIYRGLKPGGRAAVVLPDNVLFEDNVGQKVRTDLMDKCDLHTILRLPTGIFYAQGVKTNVLFFERGDTDEDNTREVWIYDMRTNMRSFGKRTPLKQSDFDDFKEAYFGARASSPRVGKREDGGEEGRFRSYTRDAIRERGDNLDITWLHDDDDVERVEDLPPPEDIATEILGNLQMAMDEMESLMAILEGDEEIIVDEPEELPN